MLRLRRQTRPHHFPRLYHPFDAQHAHSLHRLGQELSLRVSWHCSGFPCNLERVGIDDADLPRLCPFRQLYGEDDEGTDGAELEKAKEAGENGKCSHPFP